MTLEMAQNIGAEFTNLADLVAATPGKRVYAVARIVSYEGREFSAITPEPGKAPKENFPVVADLLICNGPRKGEALLAERFISGLQTATLRGVANPKSPADPLQAPRSPKTGLPWGAGTQIGIIIEMRPMFGTPRVCFNGADPDPTAAAEITAVHANDQGWANAQAIAARNAAAQAATAPAFAQPAAPVAPAAPAVDPAFAAWQAQQAQVPAYQPTVVQPSAPPAPVAPPAPAAPAIPPGMTAEQWAQFQEFQAIQAAQAGLGATPVGGPPAPRSWS